MAGNAILTTQGSYGPVATELWLQSVQTSSNVEFDDNQVKRGISYRPIRRSEMFVDFTAIWSLQRYADMDAFQEQIRTHYQLITGGDSTPMQLLYTANDLFFEGWIESAQKEYRRFDNVFIRNYRMNILLPDKTWKIAQAAQESGLVNNNLVSMFGGSWYTILPSDSISSAVTNANPLQNKLQIHSRQGTFHQPQGNF